MVIRYGIPHEVALVLSDRKMVVESRNTNDFKDMRHGAFNPLARGCRDMFLASVFFLFIQTIVLPAQEAGPKVVAEVLYLEANGHFNRGQYARAVEQYNIFLLKFPEHPKKINVQYGLGLSHFQLKKYQKAAVNLSEVLKDKGCPDVPRVSYFLGQSLLMTGRHDEAEEALSRGLKALTEPPADAKALALFQKLQRGMRISRLDALVRQKNWESVVKESNALEGIADAHSLQVSFHGALARYELKQFKEAVSSLSDLEKKVKGTPFEQQLHFLLAESLRELGRPNEALTKYEAAWLVSGAFSGEALYRYGIIQFKEENFEKAAEAFGLLCENQKGKVPNDQYQRAQIYLGRSYLECKKINDAQKVFTLMVNEVGASSEAYLWQSRVFYRQRKYVEAGKCITDALGKFPADDRVPEMLFDLAGSFIAQKKFMDAIEPLDRLLKEYKDFDQRGDVLRHNALCKHHTKLFKASLILCELFLSDFKDSNYAAEVRFLEAENHNYLGQFDKAISAYEALLKAHPQTVHHAHARVQLGVLHYELKNYQAARAPLAQVWALEQHKYKPNAGYYLAWVDFSEGKIQEAAKTFGEVSDNYPKHEVSADARLQQGTILHKSGQFAEAQKALENFIATYVGDKRIDQANYQLGLALMEQKLWQPALVNFSKVLKQSVWRDEAVYQSAWCEKRAGRKLVAIGYYKELLVAHKNSPLVNPTILELAELEFEGEDYDDAISRLTKFMESNPEQSLKIRAQYRLGWCFYGKKRYDKAAELYESALPAVPQELSIVTAWQAGESRLRNKEYALASAHYQTAIKAGKPEDKNLIQLQGQARLRLGHSQAQEKKWEDSGKTYSKFVEDYPKHAEFRTALKGIGFAHRQMQQYDKALLAFEKVVAGEIRDELGAEAQFLRGECYLDQKKYDQAIAEYIKVAIYPLQEWQAKALYELAVALERKGEPVKARDQFNRLISQYPDTQAAKVAKGQLK